MDITWSNPGTTNTNTKDWIGFVDENQEWIENTGATWAYTDSLSLGTKSLKAPTKLGRYQVIYGEHGQNKILARSDIVVTVQ